MPNLAIGYRVHDDTYYLAQSIQSFLPAGPVFVFVSRVPQHDAVGDWQQTVEVAKRAGAEVVIEDCKEEVAHRHFIRDYLLQHGFTHALIPDGDEIIEPELLNTLVTIAEAQLAERVYCHWDTYWKTPQHVIRPREGFTPLILCELTQALPVHGRDFQGGRPLLLSPQHGLIQHLSYVGPDARIQRKISTWLHAPEVVPDWVSQVWLAWDTDPLLHNLHPTHPQAYQFVERIPTPALLEPVMERYLALGGTLNTPLETPTPLPKVSVIIPLHGGRDDLRACLNSLDACQDLLHEVIVVDNASPDDAPEEAQRDGVLLLQNDSNLGFAIASNQGADAASGDALLFLNADTVVPRAGLIRLIETLGSSGSIGGAGSHSNRVGHGQQVPVTYTDKAHIELFAEDFAQRAAEDQDVDMLVGFCLLVRRTVWQEVGAFDTRFGLGTFEDNDLCYRIRRAGYRLVLAGRSFVHHEGSKTLVPVTPDPQALLSKNADTYRKKWRRDLESGYASHLSGLAPERIQFHPERHPDRLAKQTQERARRADISLCMIVKNEERVLADCLASAKPFFHEMIVVDTGSTDATVEIAERHGAKVVHYPWTDSFAAARNESLRPAPSRNRVLRYARR